MKAWVFAGVALAVVLAAGYALADVPEGDHDHDEHEYGVVALAGLVKPLGITTLGLLIVTACFGFFRKKSPRLLLRWHKRLAVFTLIAGVCHAMLVFLFH